MGKRVLKSIRHCYAFNEQGVWRKSAISILLLLLLSVSAWSQTRTISGTVTDSENNETLAGVIVIEKGTTNSTATDASGHYSVSISSATNTTLVFMEIGYGKKEMKIAEESIVNVQLKADNKKLDEVVVVAYGEAKRNEYTGALTTVDSKEIQDVPISSIDLILQGKVAGLQVESYSGQPGGESNVVLRGMGSINAGSTPLYVVDGIPINTGYVGQITWTSNSLAGIDPEDIESVSVLKDAAATAIYGSRGSNGVIIITTKKGKSGKTKFNFDANYGVNEIAKTPVVMMNTSQYGTLTHQGLINAGYSDSGATSYLNGLGYNPNVNNNWLKEVTQHGPQYNYNLSASGGDDKTQFYISGGYYYQDGITFKSDFNRISGSFKLNHRVNRHLSFNANLIISSSYQQTPYQSDYYRSSMSAAYFELPFIRPYDSTGKLNLSKSQFQDIGVWNPFAIAQMDNDYLKNRKIIGAVEGEYKFTDYLKFTSRINIDQNTTNEFVYFNPTYGDGAAYGGLGQQVNTEWDNWVWTNLLSFSKKIISDDLSVDVKVGQEAQQSQQTILNAMTEGYPPAQGVQVLSVAANPITASSSINEYAFQSYFSNAALVYKSRFSLTGTFRRDGSSVFGINNRYGNFYSVGGSWQIDKERFMKSITPVSTFRLRSSYGKTGNANIGDYAWRSLYTFGGSYNGSPASAPASTPGNNNLTWEKNAPFDIGLDAGFLKDRLNLTADYYIRKTSNLLLNEPLSMTSGYAQQLTNVGAMTNKGTELALDVVIIKSKEVLWKTDFNIAFNKNTVDQLVNNQDIINNTFFIDRVGQSVQSFYMPLYAGVDQATGSALWYTDSTKTKTTTNYSAAKPAIAGSISPKFFGGLSSSVSWKGFTFSFQFNYVSGNKIYDQWAPYFQSDGASPLNNQSTSELAAWKKPGDVTNVPEYVVGNTSNSNALSTRYLYDGSYIRLRDITLAYSFHPKFLSKSKYDIWRVYVKATNLATWVKDKRLDFDPDNSYGYGDLNIPNVKTMIAGVNLTF